MTPKILIVGRGKGSWAIRGLQVGDTLGARCSNGPEPEDWRWADVVILVKRAIDRWGWEAKESGRPIIWDVLDYWQQPAENARSQDDVIADVLQRKREMGIAALIASTRAMARDVGGVYIPHHSRPGLVPSAMLPTVRLIAYEGTPKYLGSWRDVLERACDRRGIRFVVNPATIAEADIVVALRGEQWDGWVCRQWKSGVKYVNALVAGRPVITQASAAFGEIGPAGAIVTSPDEIEGAIDEASRLQLRQIAVELAHRRAHDFALPTIAGQYRTLVRTVLEEAA